MNKLVGYTHDSKFEAEGDTAAIEFNQQECSNVNETAPNFVGCAPSNLASSIFLGSTTAASTFATSTVTFSTISGSTVTEPASFTGPKVTAAFDGRPLLTGSCSQPYFAMVTRAPGLMTEFPQIGCAPDRQDCCPYSYGANAEITSCPQDHFTTGWSLLPSVCEILPDARIVLTEVGDTKSTIPTLERRHLAIRCLRGPLCPRRSQQIQG